MNEISKTLIFVGVAAALALAAFFLRPQPFEQLRQKAGEKLFADLEDATSANALRIVQYDRDKGEAEELKIERDGDQWVIASHGDYPADANGAKDRIEETALKLMDMEVIKVASDITSEHPLYGVVSPEEDGAKDAAEKDIGMLVGLQDDQGNVLAQLIVGKKVRDDAGGRNPHEAGKRFVRKAGEKTVYTAKIDVDQLKSKFGDWIQSDLLGISSWDIRRVMVKDYNMRMVDVGRLPDGRVLQQVAYEPRFELSANWDNDKKWTLAGMEERRGPGLVPAQLGENQELNAANLDELKNAVGDLKIVDVERKPQDLIAKVKSDEDLINDPVLGQMLQEKGFYPMEGELKSRNGEVRVQTEAGIEYVLRFGNEVGVEQEEGETKLNRYLLVSARVAEEQFIQHAPAASEKTGGNAGPPLGAGGQSGAEGEAGEGADGTTASQADAAEPPPTGHSDEGGQAKSTGPDDSDNVDATKNADVGDSADGTKNTDAGDNEPPPPDTVPPETGPPNTIPPVGAPSPSAPQDDELAKKRKKAEEKVDELNKKFADWYYVISEDEYKKIRLGRSELIREKSGGEFDFGKLPGPLEGLNPADSGSNFPPEKP